MGMGPATAQMIGMLGAGIGGPVLSSLFAPDGQDVQSFEGHGAIDPATYLGHVNDMMGELGRVLANRASSPVSLPSAVVQQPGVYSGGGLPMPIGVVGMDRALENPSLLNHMGEDFNGLSELFSHGLTSAHGYDPPTGPIRNTPPGYGGDPVNPGNPTPPGNVEGIEPPGNQGYPGGRDPDGRGSIAEGRAGVTTRRGDGLVHGEDLLKQRTPPMTDWRGGDLSIEKMYDDASANAGDDFHQGVGAVQLLMHALQQGKGNLDFDALAQML